jgi:hypothetical protein
VGIDFIDRRVSLTRAATLNTSQMEKVIFTVTPTFTEGRAVRYKNIDPVHAPGAIYMFAQTQARTFNIQGKFISRSVDEATRTLAYLQYLRSWTMPVFGVVGNAAAPGENILGAPPAILFLCAYSNGHPGTQNVAKTISNTVDSLTTPAIGNNIYNVPTIITNLDIPYPSDVDYIPTINNLPVPTIVEVSIALTEAHSPNAYAKFNLQDSTDFSTFSKFPRVKFLRAKEKSDIGMFFKSSF